MPSTVSFSTRSPRGIADNTVVGNAGWTYAVASEDEWDKAAYHRNDGATGNYWAYEGIAWYACE